MPAEPRRLSRSSWPPTAASWSTPSTPRASRPASPPCCGGSASRGIDFKDLQTSAELARGHLRQPGAGQRAHEPPRHPRHLPASRWRAPGRTLLQSIASPVISTSLYFVVFGSAIGSRMARDRRRQLRRLHRAGPDHAVAPDREHLQRLVRHLHAASSPGTIYELLSAPISAVEIVHRLCRRGGDQVDHPGPDHPGHGAAVRAASRSRTRSGWLAFLVLTSVTFSLFGFIIGIWADGFEKLQIVPADDRHAADLPGRQLLLDRHAAAALAEDHACSTRWSIWSAASAGASTASPTSASASASAMTLVFLAGLPGGRLVDLPDRLPAEGVSIRTAGTFASTLPTE